MTNRVTINGFEIEVDGTQVKINSNSKSNPNDKYNIVLKDTLIKGDFNGDIKINGDNIKIIIEGNMTGDIMGNCNIDIKGNITGDIMGNVNLRK